MFNKCLTFSLVSSSSALSCRFVRSSLGVTYKTAWFMAHRIREAMRDDDPTPLGGEGEIVESDETFYGRKEGAPDPYQFSNDRGWHRRRRAYSDKIAVVTLVERGGKARSVKAEDITAKTLRAIVLSRADTKSTLMTDELRAYRRIGQRFAEHGTVNHSVEEWARRLDSGTKAHVNTAEGFFSIFKRGMVGVYQHCSEHHLPRYLAEFDFRYSNRAAVGVDDVLRTMRAIRGIEGKRLTYRRVGGEAA
jgi:transposase-like protein